MNSNPLNLAPIPAVTEQPNYKRLSVTVTSCVVKPSGLSPYNPGSS